MTQKQMDATLKAEAYDQIAMQGQVARQSFDIMVRMAKESRDAKAQYEKANRDLADLIAKYEQELPLLEGADE